VRDVFSHAAKICSSDASCTTTVTFCIQMMTVNCLHFDFGGCILSKAVYKAKDRMGQSKEGTRKVMVVVVALVAAILMIHAATYNDIGFIRCYTVECNCNKRARHETLHACRVRQA
jgi:hypothetical protein